MSSLTDRISTPVPGIRPPVPAANSQDAGTNAMATDIAAAEDMIDTHAAPPPAKAADPDGFDYFTKSGCNIDDLWRYRPGSMDGEFLGAFGWEKSTTRRDAFWKPGHDFGPATRAECERFLGWPKANPDDHDNGEQSRRTLAATVERVGTIPTCAACGSPRPTDATGADIVRELVRLTVANGENHLGDWWTTPKEPKHTDPPEAWAAHGLAMRAIHERDEKRSNGQTALFVFVRDNLAALKAALGGVQ